MFFLFYEKHGITEEEIYEAEIEISHFVLYYYVYANLLVAFIYCGILPCAMGNGDTEYGDDAGCKRLGV